MARHGYIRYWALLLFLFCGTIPRSLAQIVANFDPNDELFRQEVKLIDEFIERFNDDSTTDLSRFYSRDKEGFHISRNVMLISVFNLQDNSLTQGNDDLKEFFTTVLDKAHPVYLAFNDSDWYAEADALFLDNGKMVAIPIILHVVSQDDWAKWMIAGVGSPRPVKQPPPAINIKRSKAPPQSFISTSAHVTNFSEFHSLLTENMQPENYFEPRAAASPAGARFIAGIKKGQIRFQYVKELSFHFYHVHGFVFSVQNYTRKTFNSGWLIGGIHKVSAVEKTAAKNKLLNY